MQGSLLKPSCPAQEELAGRTSWVGWRKIDGRKVPYDLRTGQPAFKENNGAVSRPDSWCGNLATTQPLAEEKGFALGLDLQPPFFFRDYDDCVTKNADGTFTIAPAVEAELREMGTYAEYSPSCFDPEEEMGGIKAWGKLAEPLKDTSGQPVYSLPGTPETYFGKRYGAMTFKHVEFTPGELREFTSSDIDKLFQKNLAPIHRAGKKARVLKKGGEPEDLFKDKLKFKVYESNGWRFYNYHTLMGKCLAKGAAHEGNRGNNRCSSFVYEPASRKLWHYCFVTSCCPNENATRKSLIALGIDPDQIFEKGESLPPLVVSSAASFLAKKFRERPPIMVAQSNLRSPVFHTASINEVHAFRGCGKTNVMLGLAGALAKGEKFLAWEAVRKFRVLYVDGEMPGAEMQERVRSLVGPCGTFFIINAEEQPDSRIPSIAIEAGRCLIEEALIENQAEIFVADSVSTLANIATNEEEQWLEIGEWFRHLRVKYGIAVFYLHHDGKTGSQRGHSKSEDPLDKALQLYWEGEYKGQDGLKIVLQFDKARQPVREFAHLRVELTEELDGSRHVWTWSEYKPAEKEKKASDPKTDLERAALGRVFLELNEGGMGVRDIAKKYGIGKSSVAEYIKDSRAQRAANPEQIELEEEEVR